jgi:hypothetical protein
MTLKVEVSKFGRFLHSGTGDGHGAPSGKHWNVRAMHSLPSGQGLSQPAEIRRKGKKSHLRLTFFISHGLVLVPPLELGIPPPQRIGLLSSGKTPVYFLRIIIKQTNDGGKKFN